MNDLRRQKTEREAQNEAQGIRVDVDFQAMVEEHKVNTTEMAPVSPKLTLSTSPPTSSRSACASRNGLSLPMNLPKVSPQVADRQARSMWSLAPTRACVFTSVNSK